MSTPSICHAHHLGLGVVAALDREVQPAGVGQARAGQRAGVLWVAPARAALAELLHVGVAGAGEPVDDRLARRCHAWALPSAPIGVRTRCLNFGSR